MLTDEIRDAMAILAHHVGACIGESKHQPLRMVIVRRHYRIGSPSLNQIKEIADQAGLHRNSVGKWIKEACKHLHALDLRAYAEIDDLIGDKHIQKDEIAQ